MELDTLTPDLPALLIEMGIKYDPDKLAGHLASKWPQVGWGGGWCWEVFGWQQDTTGSSRDRCGLRFQWRV
jgi:hypothetical protein